MTNAIAGLVLLASMSVAYSGCFSSMERLRLSVSRRHVSTMMGVFTFAGVVQLPMSCIPILVAVVYLSAWPTYRRSGAPLHRHIYNAANVLIACLVARAAMAAVPGMVAIPVAIVTFMVVNLALVIAAIVTARQFAALAMFKNPRTHLEVVATQLLGAAIGSAMHWHVALGLLGLPVMFGVHAIAVRGTVAVPSRSGCPHRHRPRLDTVRVAAQPRSACIPRAGRPSTARPHDRLFPTATGTSLKAGFKPHPRHHEQHPKSRRHPAATTSGRITARRGDAVSPCACIGTERERRRHRIQLAGSQLLRLRFPNNGTGHGTAVKNNAASAEDQGNVEASTYYNENYQGSQDWMSPQSYGNLYLTWNDEASGGPWF